MNKVTWVIQTNLLNDHSVQGVWLAAEECGAGVKEAIVVPFQDELGNEDELQEMLVEENHVVIPYGSTKLTRISQQRGWSGNCFDPETFKTELWNTKRDDMLNQDSVQMAVKDIPKFFEGKVLEEKWFIRPVEDLKAFNGTVTEAAEMINWMQHMGSNKVSSNFSENTQVSISPVKKIYSESRFFVVGGKVVNGSYYRQGGRLMLNRVQQPETMAYAQAMADKWLPHECCVMDLADTDDGIKVIEFNTLNGSGFYDNDIKVIVSAMTEWARNK